MRPAEQDGIIKTGRVELGQTPSVVSGHTSETLDNEEPVVKGEVATDPGLKKLISLLPQ